MRVRKIGNSAFSALMAGVASVAIASAQEASPPPVEDAAAAPPVGDTISAASGPVDPTQFGLAPGAPAPVIRAINVRGNQRIEADTIASYLVVHAGDQADPQLLDVGLKTLFNTGLFADVSLAMQPDDTLLIEISENPIVNRVLIEGNRRVKDDKITEEVQLAARGVFTRAKAQADVQRIIEVYRRSGRFAATVTPKVTPLDQNRVDVVYEIDEGPKTGVAKVNFIGNKSFSSAELRGAILTRESRWWRFFSNKSTYDPDKLEYERELLRQFYARNGYADFQVVSAVAELTPDRKDFFITFTVDEGEKYRIGEVRVKTSLSKLDENALESFVPIKSGEIYDGERVEKTTESLTFATGSAGYAFVDVQPRLNRNPETKTVDITFDVNEGPRVYVGRINIRGNSTTLDKVIRRELRIAEGDAFNRVLVDRSKTRIRSLDYFKEVEIEEKPGSAPDRTDLDVSVEEKATGAFSVGVGVSSTENFILDFSVEQRNLMGRGQFLRFRVQASSRTRTVDIRFTQPYFLDRNLAAGFSISNSRVNFRESGFTQNRYGFGLNAGFQVSEYARGSVFYQLARDNVNLNEDSIFNQITQQVVDGTDITNLFVPGATVPTLTPLFVDGNGIVTTTDTGTRFTDLAGQPISQYSAFICDLFATSITSTCEQRGRFLTSLIGYSLSYDTRDNPIDTTRGIRLNFSQSFAGLGGDVNYWRSEGLAAYYRPIYKGFIGKIQIRGGYVDGYGGDNVRIQDRFFEGAGTFRGFEVAGVGPRALSNVASSRGTFGRAIGGKIYAIATAEIYLPLPLPKEYGIRASLFSDFGTVGLVDESVKAINDDVSFFVDPDQDGIFEEPIQDDLSPRLSAGVSVGWDSPFGPVRFDIARVLLKEDYDETEGFRFSAGTSF